METTMKMETPDNMRRRQFISSAVAATTCMGLPSLCWGDDLPRSENWTAELARHRIARIEQRTVTVKWPRLVGKNAFHDVHGRGQSYSVVVLHTDRGATGWGMGGFGRDKTVADQLGKQLKGKSVVELFAPAVGILPGCPAVLDFALHDLAGVILNQPVYALLGGSEPRATPCYSGMFCFDDLEPAGKPAGIDALLADCKQDYELGYRQFKIKISRGRRWMPHDAGLARDIEVVRAIAGAYPDVKLLVDANDGFTMDDVKRFLDGIGNVELLWIEEPFRESVAGFRDLRAALKERGRKTYIADGETNPNVKLLDELIEKKLLDVYLTDIVGYGFTAYRKQMPRLKESGVFASPHAFGTQLKTYCIVHLLPAIPKSWSSGQVTGLCARGGFDVDIAWNDGKLTRAVVRSKLGKPCVVRYGDERMPFDTKAGETHALQYLGKLTHTVATR